MPWNARTAVASVRALGRVAAIAAFVAALSAGPPTVRADAGDEPTARLEVRESLIERVRRHGPRGRPVVELRRHRRSRVDVHMTGDVPGDDELSASTPVALRVGSLVLESNLGADPRWEPGRRIVRLEPLPEDPATTLTVRWSRCKVRVELRTRSDLLLGDPGDETPDGPIERTFDAAAAFGNASWFLRATAEGSIRRGELRLPDEVVPLRNARLSGTGVLAAAADDPVAPALSLTAPSEGLLNTEPVTHVTGSAQDDRAVARVTWSLDGGDEVEVAVTPDPAVSPVRGQRVTFDFGVPVTAGGLHTLRIAAYDLGGSVAAQDVAFAYVVPVDLPLATGGARGPVSLAVVHGVLFTWGNDELGGLANGGGPSEQEQPTPTGVTGVLDVSMGQDHGLALRDDGTIVAWGRNTAGKLGIGSSDTSVRESPVPVVGIDDGFEVATGLDFSLALRSDGTVWGWGSSSYKQLGAGFAGQSSTVPVPVEGLSQVVAVAAGAYQSVALLADGTVRCWGYTSLGGTPSAPGALVQPLLASGAPLDGVAEVKAGFTHFLARRSDGTVFVWGSVQEDSGGLGLGPGVDAAPLPTPIPAIAGAVSIAASIDAGFAVLGDGTLLAWGRNWEGQLGDGTFDLRPTPALVPGIADAVRVSAGSMSKHVLAQLRTNVVMGWGYYSIGNAVPVPSSSTTTPVLVPLPLQYGE
jgi:alpha-tubulin suppressor-like RCC1 family protein